MPRPITTHDYLWWCGQIVALMLTVGFIWHGQSGAVAAAVGYALSVLVDIREAVLRRSGDA